VRTGGENRKERGCGPPLFFFAAAGWWCLALFASIFLSYGTVKAGEPISLYGDWRYQTSSENGDSRQLFTQGYNMYFDDEITEAMGLSGGLRYNRESTEGQITEFLTPNLAFDVSNDIFRFDLSGTATQRKDSEGPDFSDRSWEATWSSAWRREWWPDLRAFYGESSFWDDQSPRVQDRDSSQAGLNVNWKIPIVSAFYSYYDTENTDRAAASQDTNQSHFARLQADRSFWDNRLSIAVSQQYSRSVAEFQFSGDLEESKIPITNITALYEVDETPLEGELDSNDALIDHIKDAAALEIKPDDAANIGLGFGLDFQGADLLYLYTVETLRTDAERAFKWDVYVSDDNFTWTLKSRNIEARDYELAFRRFVIDLPGISSRYIKLVASAWPNETVAFSEIEVFRKATSKHEKTEYEDYLTDVGLSFRLATDLNLTYNLSLETATTDPGSERKRRTQAGTLRWTPSRYFAPGLSISESTEKTTEEKTTEESTDNAPSESEENAWTVPETLNRSYSLVISSQPLDTLDLSTSVTHRESYEDSTKITTSQLVSFYAGAALFPDLDSSLDLTYNTTDHKEDGTETQSYGARWIVTARLSPKLTADLATDYLKTKAETDSDAKSTTLSLTWRPSDDFSLRGTADKTWETDGDKTALSMIASVSPTEKTQFSLSYGFIDSTSTTQSYGVFYSWTISPVFTVQFNGTYRIEEEDSPWSVGGQLTARF
jgi:hypothetical protein